MTDAQRRSNGRARRAGRALLHLLLVPLAVSLAACDTGAPGRPAAVDTPPAQQHARSPKPKKPKKKTPQPPALDCLREAGNVRLLTVYSIGRFYLDGGELHGTVYDASRRFESFLNRHCPDAGQPCIRVALHPVARGQLLPALLAGRGDAVAASVPITPKRQAEVDFSDPVDKPLAEILLTGPSAPPLADIDDLSGRTIYLRRDSDYRDSVEQLNTRLRQAGRAPVAIDTVADALDDDDLVEMVNAGLLPWTIVDDYRLNWWQGVFTDITLREDIVFSEGVATGWAMRKDCPALRTAINDFLRTEQETPLVSNVIADRHFHDFTWASNALAPEAQQRYKTLEPLFRKYGERYGIDPLLLAALAYAESRMNQSARGPNGSVGIMQIKPDTARIPAVNITDIQQTESNIHAGARYLAVLRDQYFNSPDIEPADRNLLAVGAYNMGPGRMVELRDTAAQMGYDPNVWFNNVELAAALTVGDRPVHYIGTIYKYYQAYQLADGATPPT